MNRLCVLVAVAACGGTSGSSEQAAAGPVFTPGVAYALHGVAPDCAMKRDAGGEVWTCTGRPGSIVIATGAEKKLRSIEFDFRSMTLPQVKAHLVPALTPVIAKAGTDALAAQLDKLRTGDRAQLQAAGATIDVVAGGTSQIAPEYSVDLRW